MHTAHRRSQPLKSLAYSKTRLPHAPFVPFTRTRFQCANVDKEIPITLVDLAFLMIVILKCGSTAS